MTIRILLCLLVLATPAAAQNYPGLDVSTIFVYPGPCRYFSGTGSPEGAIVGSPCDVYVRTDGSAGVLFYRKESGTATNTGWENTVSKSSLNHWTAEQQFSNTATHPDFVSWLSNWQIRADGSGYFTYLQALEMRVKLLSAEETAVYRGSLMVAHSYGEISQTFTCPAPTATSTLWVLDAATLGDARVFTSGSYVVVHTFTRTDTDLDGAHEVAVGDCVGVVTSYTDGSGVNAGQQSWTFTRSASPFQGTLANGSTVTVKNVAVEYGIVGNGYIELNATDGAESANAPWIRVAEIVGVPAATNRKLRVNVGNLNGSFGYSTKVYGFAAGDEAGTRITIEPTNGIRIRKPDGTVVLQADASGNLSMIGTFTVTGGNAATTSYVDTAEADAVAAAATDATTKANAAAAASLDKVTYLDTTTIKGGMITTGSITATQIQAATITADKLTVSSLGAISAVLGTVAVSGSSSLSGGNVTIDSGGITIAPRTADETYEAARAYRFTVASGKLGMSGSTFSSGRYLRLEATTTAASTVGAIDLYTDYNSGTAFGGFSSRSDNTGTRVTMVSRGTGSTAYLASDGRINLDGTIYGGSSTTTAVQFGAAGAKINGGALQLTTATAPGFGGALWVDATYGLVLNPYYVSGNTSDLAIPNAANTALVAYVPAFTDDWSFGAATAVAIPTVGASVTTGICTNASSVLIACPSDARLKQHVTPYKSGLSAIRRLRPVAYRWAETSGMDTTKPMVGFVAQQVRKVMSDATATTTDGYLTVDDRALIAALVNAVQEQQTQIETLRKEIQTMKDARNGR